MAGEGGEEEPPNKKKSFPSSVITGGAVSGVVPATEAFAVHYPGYPSTPSRAVETLGGIDRIVEARNSLNAKLELRFRPEDPYCHPAFGEPRICNGLLLKITKTCSRKSDHGSSSSSQPTEELKAEIVARILSSYHFQGMVDYQYVVPIHAAQELHNKKRNWENVGAQVPNNGVEKKRSLLGTDSSDVMMLVPRRFSLKDMPQRIVLKPPANLFSKNMQMGVVQQSWEMQIETCIALDFNIENIPKKIDWEAHTPKETDEWKWQMAVSKLFEERPIWPRWSVLERLTEDGIEINRDPFKRLLFRVGYYFSRGPFGKFWIRKGYDPRQDPDSRIYQRIDFRMPPSLRCPSADKDGNLEQKWKDLCRFQVFPSKRSVCMQLYELDDDFIQKEIRKPSLQTTCTHSTGWFSADMFTAFLYRVKVRFLSIYPNGGVENLLKSANSSFERAQKREALRRYPITENEKGLSNHTEDLGDESNDLEHEDDDEDEDSSSESDNEDDQDNEGDDNELDPFESPLVEGEDEFGSPYARSHQQPGENTHDNVLQELLSGFQFDDNGKDNESGGMFEDPDGRDEDEYQIYEQFSEDEDDYYDDNDS